MLNAFAIQQEIRRGATEFDFLRGDEPNKYAWGARNRWNHRRLLWTHPGLGGLVPRLHAWERALDRLVRSTARRLSQGR